MSSSSANNALAEAARARAARAAASGAAPSAAAATEATSLAVRSAPAPTAGGAPPAAPGGPPAASFSWFRGSGAPPAARAAATAPSASDSAMAARLQQEELLHMASERRQGAASAADREIAGKVYIDDPVWGRWVQPGPPGTQPRWYTTFCLGCCPCCVPPCFTAARQEGCWRVAKTAAFALSLIQVAVFIASLCIRGFAPLAINSGFGPWGDTLDWMGAKNAYKILNGDIVNYFLRDGSGTVVGYPPLAERLFSGPQPWRLVTNIFLHSGVIHIVLNLVLQLRLALHAEVVWGMWRFLPVYMASGITGALWSAVINPTQLSVGASGALLGVVGAWFVFQLCHFWHGDAAEQGVRKQQIIMTGINILIIMVMSAIPLIDWACHLFGLFSGMLLGLWYFGAALGGPAFAHDAPSLIAAQRAALANARAIASGAALPAIPGAVAAGATAAASSHWQGAGAGRSVASSSASGAGKGGSGGGVCGACAGAGDAASDCLCQPMTPINMACGADAPPGLTRGAMLSVGGLLGFFVLVAVGFGLLYGGGVPFPPPMWGKEAGDEIYVMCFNTKRRMKLNDPSFQCPWPLDNLGGPGSSLGPAYK